MMKKYVFLMSVFAVLISCNTKKPETKVTPVDTAAPVVKKDTTSIITDTHYFWSAELGEGGLVMVKTRPAALDSLTAPHVIGMLNSQYPQIILRLIKISGDTVYVKIPKSDYLTRQMGTSGSEAYLAEATYNLTEIKDIDFVDFAFKEGDHAQPGTFSRTDFIRIKN
jgi:hypothetical protein